MVRSKSSPGVTASVSHQTTLQADNQIKTVSRPGFRFIAAKRAVDLTERYRWSDPAEFDTLEFAGRSVEGGRGPNQLLENILEGESIRIRPMRHGGLFRSLLTDRYLDPNRVLREFRLWTRLRLNQVPLPEPAFAVSRRRGPTWRAYFATIERRNAYDGLAWLKRRPDSEAMTSAGTSVARALRRLHDSGVVHGDLNLRNILFEDDSASQAIHCWLIDLDRATQPTRISPAARMREWMRLARSLEKQGARDSLTPALGSHVIDAYCNGDSALRTEMLNALPRERRRNARHRFFWRFSQGRPGLD
jgi:tRNA A-37 threonylcarbamoyl transferase component Bud32